MQLQLKAATRAVEEVNAVVSIPQAVSTIAIRKEYAEKGITIVLSFNTASGKYYCNPVGAVEKAAMAARPKFQYRKR